MPINVYLTFDGRCEEAFGFYQSVLGGQIICVMPFAGSPMEESTSPEWRGKVMHASITIDGLCLMGTDCGPERYQPPQGFAVSLQIEDPAEAERKFAALADGGTVTLPLDETFWALRFGMLTDRYGIPWMVNCSRPQE